MPKDLADEERIALRLVAHDPREVAASPSLLLSRSPLEEVDDVIGREAVQRYTVHALHPSEVGEHVRERIATLQIRVAVGAHDEHTHRR